MADDKADSKDPIPALEEDEKAKTDSKEKEPTADAAGDDATPANADEDAVREAIDAHGKAL